MLHRGNGNNEIDNLKKLSRAELRVLWERELGSKAPRTLGRDILALGIAYARQERSYGGLARPVAKELDRLLARVLQDEAADAPRGKTHQSLSSIARAITGTNWNGPRFFGMREPKKLIAEVRGSSPRAPRGRARDVTMTGPTAQRSAGPAQNDWTE